MRNTAFFLVIAIVALALIGCEQLLTDIDPEFQNPVDPESEEYQGFESVDDPNAVEAEGLDTEEDGPFYFPPGLVASELVEAEAYEFQVATAADFEASQIVITEQIESNVLSSWTAPGEDEYFWRVRARSGDKDREWGVWSSEHGPVEAGYISGARPADGENRSDTTPLLEWDDVVSAASYDVEVSEDSEFGTTVDSATGLTDPEYHIGTSLDRGMTYYWRVRVENEDGVNGDWSSVWEFTIEREFTITIEYYLQAGPEQPDSGENLQVYYEDSSGNVVLLNEYTAGDVNYSSGKFLSETISSLDSPDAFHSSFNLAFGQVDWTSGSGYDHWYLDDVEVTVGGTTVFSDDFSSGSVDGSLWESDGISINNSEYGNGAPSAMFDGRYTRIMVTVDFDTGTN